MDSATGIFSGIVGIFVIIFALVLAVYWLLFPIIIYSKLSKVERQLDKLNRESQDWRGFDTANQQRIVVATERTADLLAGARVERPPVV
jgi:hypothetical protein